MVLWAPSAHCRVEEMVQLVPVGVLCSAPQLLGQLLRAINHTSMKKASSHKSITTNHFSPKAMTCRSLWLIPLSSLVRSCYSDSSLPVTSITYPWFPCQEWDPPWLLLALCCQLLPFQALLSPAAGCFQPIFPEAQYYLSFLNKASGGWMLNLDVQHLISMGTVLWVWILCALFTWCKTTEAKSSHISGGVSPLILSQWRAWHLERGCQLRQTRLHNLNSTLGRLPASCATRSRARPSFPLVICHACFRHFSSLLSLQGRGAVGTAASAQGRAGMGACQRQLQALSPLCGAAGRDLSSSTAAASPL